LSAQWCGRYEKWSGGRWWSGKIIYEPVGIQVAIIEVDKGVINLSKTERARRETQVTGRRRGAKIK